MVGATIGLSRFVCYDESRKRGQGNDARYQVTPMKKSIAIWAGIGLAAASQAVFVVRPSESADWIGLSQLWDRVETVAAPVVIEPVPAIAKIEFDVDELVRHLQEHVSELQRLEFGFGELAEGPIVVQTETVVEVEVKILEQCGEQAFTYSLNLCPDRPEIPSWAWAWELSTPEGW